MDSENNQILDFIKYILNDMVSKITIISTLLNDVSRQVNVIVVLDNQPPSRSELLDKINNIPVNITHEVQDKFDQHREEVNIDGKKYLKKLNEILDLLKIIVNKIEVNESKLSTTIKILGALCVVVPVAWGFFYWIHAMGWIDK